jgi:DNA-binding response OmpR family regulator
MRPESRLPRVLIIDDERAFVRALAKSLQVEGYEVKGELSALDGLRVAYEWSPDLILLDISMPGMSGHDACKRLRDVCQVPIVVISALGSEAEIVRSFREGADDYLVKPFRLAELKARIRALLRRVARVGALAPLRYQDKTLVVDSASLSVERQGERVFLSRTELRLLTYLLEKRGQIVSRGELVRALWGQEGEVEERRLSLYVRYLRRKLEVEPHHPQYVRNRFGVGYWFHGEGDPEPE